jgi:hypothetical protein
MDKRKGIVLAVGTLLVAATAIAQSAHTEYSAGAAAASATLSPEARRAMRERIEAAEAAFRATHGGRAPEEFGLQCCQITQIPAQAFVPETGGGFWELQLGLYIARTTVGASSLLWAPVSLPTGTYIVYLDLYYKDTDPANNISADLWEQKGGGPLSGAPTSTFVGGASSSGSPGYGYATKLLDYTVNNNVAYDPAAAQLAVVIDPQSVGNLVQFKAVDFWWLRQISPAPVTATFSDVPTNHPFFQFVEALAAAGITVGYPDGRFGVDDPITRGQMAVFMAKALGLYWPL